MVGGMLCKSDKPSIIIIIIRRKLTWLLAGLSADQRTKQGNSPSGAILIDVNSDAIPEHHAPQVSHEHRHTVGWELLKEGSRQQRPLQKLSIWLLLSALPALLLLLVR